MQSPSEHCYVMADSSEHDSLKLFRHQITGVSTMLELEQTAFNCGLKEEPALQAGIMADNMGLGKTIQILTLTHVA